MAQSVATKVARNRTPRRTPSKTWRVNTPSGGKTLLYRRYRDARSRAHGRGTSKPWVYPTGWPWKSFAEFRAWALANGFSKVNNSPDRDNADKPYGPGNITWKPPRKNYATSRGSGYYGAKQRSEPGCNDCGKSPCDCPVPF